MKKLVKMKTIVTSLVAVVAGTVWDTQNVYATVESPEDYTSKMKDGVISPYFTSITDILKTFFSSISGIVTIIAALACMGTLICAFIYEEQRKKMLIAAVVTFAIALLALIVYNVFGT